MRLQKRRSIEDLGDPDDTDPSWAHEEPSAMKIAPQAFVGTSKTIMTSHPNFIEIKYKAKYQINSDIILPLRNATEKLSNGLRQ